MRKNVIDHQFYRNITGTSKFSFAPEGKSLPAVVYGLLGPKNLIIRFVRFPRAMEDQR